MALTEAEFRKHCDEVLNHLNRALDEGFKEFDKIKAEPAFAALAGQEGFTKIMDRIAELSAEESPR